MSSPVPKPGELAHILEEYSFKLEDYKRKFNPFFSQLTHELIEKVDAMRIQLEKYAHYDRDHQLQHLLESHTVQKEMTSLHQEMHHVHSRFEGLEKIFKMGKYNL